MKQTVAPAGRHLEGGIAFEPLHAAQPARFPFDGGPDDDDSNLFHE